MPIPSPHTATPNMEPSAKPPCSTGIQNHNIPRAQSIINAAFSHFQYLFISSAFLNYPLSYIIHHFPPKVNYSFAVPGLFSKSPRICKMAPAAAGSFYRYITYPCQKSPFRRLPFPGSPYRRIRPFPRRRSHLGTAYPHIECRRSSGDTGSGSRRTTGYRDSRRSRCRIPPWGLRPPGRPSPARP